MPILEIKDRKSELWLLMVFLSVVTLVFGIGIFVHAIRPLCIMATIGFGLLIPAGIYEFKKRKQPDGFFFEDGEIRVKSSVSGKMIRFPFDKIQSVILFHQKYDPIPVICSVKSESVDGYYGFDVSALYYVDIRPLVKIIAANCQETTKVVEMKGEIIGGGTGLVKRYEGCHNL